MMRIIILFLVLSAAPRLLFAEVDVHFTTLDESFVVVADAHGIISKSRDGLVVGLGRLTLTANRHLPKAVRVSGCRIGIAEVDKNGAWKVTRWSGALQLDRNLAASESLTLKKVSGLVPLDGVASLKGYLLVLEVRVIFQARELSTYAHGDGNVFESL
jgi:hypothetical protein